MGKEVEERRAANLSRSPYPRSVLLTDRGTSPEAHAGFPKLSGHETPFPRSIVFRNWSHGSASTAHLLTKGAVIIPAKARFFSSLLYERNLRACQVQL